MAVAIHVARVGFFATDRNTGAKIDKEAPTTTINDVLESEHQHLLVEDSAIPNTSGSPTVKAYLEAEASDNFVLYHMDQSTIVTYDQSQINAI